MDKSSLDQESVGWNYLSILKLQRLHRWSLGMDEKFHPTLYDGCIYLFMVGLKLIYINKTVVWSALSQLIAKSLFKPGS